MSKKNKYIFPIVTTTFILLSIFPTGCVDDSLQQEEIFRQAVDTLYHKRIKKFGQEIDSICNARKDSLIEYNMDSIRQVRLREIEKLTRQ